MNRTILSGTLLGTALFLGACNQVPAVQPAPASPNMVTLTVRSNIGPRAQALARQGLKRQGIPNYGGAPLVNLVKVKVYAQGSNTPATFNDQNVFDPNGTHSYISLTPTQNTATILVPQGVYSLENVGKLDTTDDSTDNGQFLAYGMNADVNLSGPNPSVTLDIHTLADADASSFAPALPMSFVTLNQKFDLSLQIHTAAIGAGASANVPLADYTVIGYTAPGGTLGTGSPLGVKITADQPGGVVASLSASATVRAWVQTGAETAAQQQFTLSFGPIPFSPTGLGADLTPPTVHLNAPAGSVYQNSNTTITGDASDEKSMGKVQVYDGSVLIASTDSADAVALIAFDVDGDGHTLNTWHFDWTPSSVGAHDLEAIATDAASNESHATQTITVSLATYDVLLSYANNGGGYYDYRNYTVAANSDTWVKVDTNGYTGTNFFDFYSYSNHTSGLTATYGPTRDSQSPMIDEGYYFYARPSGGTTYYMHLTNTNAYPVEIQAYAANSSY